MKPLILLLLSCWTCAASVVTSEFVTKVIWIESRNNPNAVGRHGELGLMQLKAIAVRDVNNKFGWRYRHRDVLDPAIGVKVGTALLRMQEQRLSIKLRRQPTEEEVYRAYQRGFRGSLKKINLRLQSLQNMNMTPEEIAKAETRLNEEKSGFASTDRAVAVLAAQQACHTLDMHGLMIHQSAFLQAWWNNHQKLIQQDEFSQA